MILSRIWASAQSDSSQLALYRWLTKSFAAAMLAVILAINILFWPVPYLGFHIDFSSATIVFVEPRTSAAQAGLQAGDHILRLYDRPWDEVVIHPNLLSLIGPREQPVSVTIERAGVTHTFALEQGTPDIASQVGKVASIFLALLCWLTGYILGIIRRHDVSSSPLVACFWLALGGVLGCYPFARSVSYPLMLVLQWVMFTVLLPAAVYIHLWYPPRPVQFQQGQIARWAFIGSWLLLNIGLVISIALWRPSLITMVVRLSGILPVGLLVGFIGSGVILRHAYRRTRVAHVRRQIRLIAMACFFVASAWLLLLVLPSFIGGAPVIADHWIDLISGAVPLAYLVGGVAPDLYRLDRVLLRLGVDLGTILVLAGILAAVTTAFALHGILAVLWTTSCFVILYGPVQHLGLRLIPTHAHPVAAYSALQSAATKLTTSLDARVLVDALCTGVRAAFEAPALALYIGNIEGTNELTLTVQERLPNLPTTIAPGKLTDQLRHLSLVTESRMLHTTLAQRSLGRSEEEVVHHPGVVLWCPIRHSQGHLLAVLLLGMRGDLDPYRAQDLQELQRLLEAAALAFANSAAYTQQCEAEAIIRQLYQRLQIAQDTTAAAIARELHDEILNVNVRLNIQSLQKLLNQVSEPAIRAELELLLESERTEAQVLRMICEQLHPTGIDDPLGFSAVLRMQVARVEASWTGACHLFVEGSPCPISTRVQREALGIAVEALNNAVKHAAATEIVIRLRYPSMLDEQVQLVIHDNGCTGQVIAPRTGHWGVRNMYERARSASGTLQFCREADCGTTVMFTFSPEAAMAVA